jgi:uncharacterized protein Yka (UPF0111/DUF47 family)
MLQWFQRLMPRQNVFFPAFERHAAVMVKAAVALREMVAGDDQLKSRIQDILDLEHEADGIAREVLLGLRTTFITPFDRSDIKSLITSMDDSVDQCKATAKAIMLFEMTKFERACAKWPTRSSNVPNVRRAGSRCWPTLGRTPRR